MDIKGIYEQERLDEEQRKVEEEKRRRDRMPVKIGEFEANPYDSSIPAYSTVKNMYGTCVNLFIFKPKKTQQQVLDDFRATVEARADELDSSFVNKVRDLGIGNVELVYMPVYYFQIKKLRDREYSSKYHGGPEYISLVEGHTFSAKHYLNEFLPVVKRLKTPEYAFGDNETSRDFAKKMAEWQAKNGESGELSMADTAGKEAPEEYVFVRERYYDTSAEATLADLVHIDDVADKRVFPFNKTEIKSSTKIPSGKMLEECEILQTLLFPMWIVSVAHTGKKFSYYVSDIATGVSYYNMPHSREMVQKMENRLLESHGKRSALRAIVGWGFLAVLIAGLIAFFGGMKDSWGDDPVKLMVAMIGYPILLAVHIANLSFACRFPFPSVVPYAKIEETQRRLEEYEKRSVKKDYIVHLIILAVVAIVVALDLFIF